MRTSSFAPSALAWTLAAVLAVLLPSAPAAHAARAASAAQQLSAQLPGNVTLAKASVAQTAAALHEAVASNPGMAAALTKTALVAKSNSKGRKLSVGEVKALVSAALSAAPSKSSDIIEAALSLYPGYADQLNELALSTVENLGNGPDGFHTPQNEYGGFGVGFGAGFPGSPGFTGSPPSGAIALPGGDLTSVVNG